MPQFWLLETPWARPGRKHWEALWAKPTQTSCDPCPLDPQHVRNCRRSVPLTVRVRSHTPTDFLYGSGNEWLCSRRAQEAFAAAKLRGYELSPAEVFRPKEKVPDKTGYAELRIRGWGGIAAMASGVHLLEYCPGCDRQEYRIYYAERAIDPMAWDGSDFFIVWPMTEYVFCSEAARDAIVRNTLSGVTLIPVEEFGKSGTFSPGSRYVLSDEQRRLIRERFDF